MRSVIVHGLLAVFGLAFAYQTWTRGPAEEESPAGSVTMVECELSALQSLRMDTPTDSIVAEPERSEGETRYWITKHRKSKQERDEKPEGQDAEPKEPKEQDQESAAKPADSPAPAQGEENAEAKDPADKPKAPAKEAYTPAAIHRFRANAVFGDYLARLTPLRAARALGQVKDDALEAFGFDKIGTRISITCGGKTSEIEVGARTFGTGQRYVRDGKTKAAYLVQEALVADLKAAQFKFMQYDLHAFPLSEVDAAVIEARGARKRLLHRDRKLSAQATWVDASEPSRRNELYGNWFSRLSRVRAREYLPKGGEPGADLTDAADQITPVFTIDYELEGKPKGKLELVRVDAGQQAHYYVRTETTRGWVNLHPSSVKEIEQDIGMVVGSEAPAASTQPD